MTAVVELDHVWKRYLLGEGRGLRDLFGSARRHELWSVQDLTLRIEPGESVGLIGHNGAGKTTTLKLLAGITRPTRGRVSARGRVASLINLGAGFHRELTGRENVYLNGVILGLSRSEVRDRFDRIVDFAEIGPYVDTPVKQYSSGMYARLGFAVAAHVEPDVLLVDEVLSVGDISFQDRSIRKMLSFRDRGCGILFVSHNLSAIEMMCQRTIWLDHGQVRMAGPTSEVIPAYLQEVDEQLVAAAGADPVEAGNGALVVEDVTIHAATGEARSEFESGEPLRVRLHCVARTSVHDVVCRVTVRGDYGPLFAADTGADGERLPRWERGRQTLDCLFESLPVLPGLYRVETLVSHSGSGDGQLPQTLAAFRVTTGLSAFGSRSVVGATKSRGGFLAVPYRWRLEAGGSVRDLPGLQAPASGAGQGAAR